MPLIPFPNVPNVPGVPAILRHATVPTLDSLVNQGVSALVQAIFGKEEWGIYQGVNAETGKGGTLFLKHDVFMSIEFKNLFQVSNHPQEDGAFASYNKVGTPYDCRVQLVVGEDAAKREGFLGKLDGMLKSIELYDIMTPEFTYTDATLQNYQYRRTAKNGVRVIVADLWFVEVRKNAESKQQQTAEPQAQKMTIGGQIQQQFQDAKTYFQKAGDDLRAFGKPLLDLGKDSYNEAKRWLAL